MNLDSFTEQLPDFAKDIRLNLGSVVTAEGSPGLNLKQIYGIALSCAYSTKNLNLIHSVLATVKAELAEAEVTAAQAASTIMAMNNVYYRTQHFMANKEIAKLPARLRMNVIGKPGIDKVDFELYCLAVSAIEGCDMCVNSHITEVQKAGISNEGVQSAIKIGAVINAAATADSIAKSAL